MFNVKDFGAIGDGVAKDQVALQSAIDACHAAGGGKVVVPAGTYLTGTIYLKDYVHLELLPGAVIFGSPDLEEYNAPDAWPQNWTSVIEKANGRHLVVGVEVSHVTISGGGRIDGNRAAFFDPYKYTRANFPGTRPSHTVYFVESDHVVLENIEIFNATYWSCFLHGCEDVRIRGVNIRNDRATWNGDGLDIDCCRRVTVSDCNIVGSDDCIAIRADCRRLKDQTRACEDITIANCVLQNREAGIRFGVGNGIIRRCCVTNLAIRSGMGIVIHSDYADDSVRDKTIRPPASDRDGTDISELVISNLHMVTRIPFIIMSNYVANPRESTKVTIRDVMIRGVRAHGNNTTVIQGNHDMSVRNINFSDIDLVMHKGEGIANWKAASNCSERFAANRPYAFYAANVVGLHFNNVRLSWADDVIPGSWTHAMLCANVKDMTIQGSILTASENGKDIEQLDEWNEFI